ncbi:MAG: radical SAM family heme chaperone HemW [Clostridia bacterium]|nr:radical SAM family heme chaperone HemW [Clostridia bacterium]
MDRTDKTGVYIHIPFCRSKCPYCDFYSLPGKSCNDDYVAALCDEIRSFRGVGEFVKERKIPVDTVYFGGGTPSLLTPLQLERILEAVRESFIVSPDSEITVECNPSSPSLDTFLKRAAELGVNRISLGMQSSDNAERRLLGRKGSSENIKAAVECAKNAGIENISLDVMVGVPESNTRTLKSTLDFALSLGVPHISAYMLKIEEGTYYYRNQDKLSLPTEDETADMYLFMSHYLTENGFLHYEISNFCKDGLYSRHNMKYWEGTPYIGFGPSAHSFYDGRRFYFPDDISSFINDRKAFSDGTGGDSEEMLMLMLRTYKGISLQDKTEKFKKIIDMYVSHGLGREANGRFFLTPEGMLISNSIIIQLINALD